MIIACPACGTRYVVPDSAIGADGRTVRCAKCRHSWHQQGSTAEARQAAPPPPAPAPPVAPQSTPAAPPRPAPAPPPPAPPPPSPVEEPRPEPVPAAYAERPEPLPTPPPPAPEPFASEPTTPPPAEYEQPEAEPDRSQFDYEPPFRPRRNPLRLWTYAAAIFAIFAVGTVLSVSYWGLPDWVPVSRPTFGVGQADLVLDFPADQQDRRQLPNGTEFFGASGTVTNVGRETRTLPPILIVLRDGRDRIVYSWEVAPPQRTLAPGESVSINEAVTDVPKAAKVAEIGWKPS